jgi:hypothetical protein
MIFFLTNIPTIYILLIKINYRNCNICIFHYKSTLDKEITLYSLVYSTSLGPIDIQHIFWSTFVNLSQKHLAKLYTFTNLLVQS